MNYLQRVKFGKYVYDKILKIKSNLNDNPSFWSTNKNCPKKYAIKLFIFIESPSGNKLNV